MSAWARDLVAKSQPKDPDADPRDTLTPFDRNIVGASSVMIRLPLYDPVEVRRHLALIEETCHALRLRMEKSAPDRAHLFMVRGVMRQLTKKINAYYHQTPRAE